MHYTACHIPYNGPSSLEKIDEFYVNVIYCLDCAGRARIEIMQNTLRRI